MNTDKKETAVKIDEYKDQVTVTPIEHGSAHFKATEPETPTKWFGASVLEVKASDVHSALSPLGEVESGYLSPLVDAHKVNGLNEAINIMALDKQGPGGAYHKYGVSYGDKGHTVINFQYGPIKENGVNGISIEALIAIAAHRLMGFQTGKFACKDNDIALTKLEEALMWLHKRTHDRMRRGVEGTSIK